MSRVDNIAIIGAGLSGALLAQRIQRLGLRVSVYEKARGPGGRLSTRRTELGRYNHGAPRIEARHVSIAAPDLSKRMESEGTGRLPTATNETVRLLLDGIPVSYGSRVAGLQGESDQWLLLDDAGNVLTNATTVLVTAPAPQAADLLGPTMGAWADSLRALQMTPSWVVLMKLSPAAKAKSVLHRSARIWNPRPPIAEHPDCLVYEASTDWARQNLDASHAQIIEDCLESIGVRLTELEEVQAHRWRYANCLNPLAEFAFWDPKARLGVAGDAFAAGASAEGIVRALRSAEALAALCAASSARP